MGYQTFVIINVEAFDASVEKTTNASKAQPCRLWREA